MVGPTPVTRVGALPSAPWWRIPDPPAAPRSVVEPARPRPDRVAAGDHPAAALGEVALFWFFGGHHPLGRDRRATRGRSWDGEVAAAAQQLGVGPGATQAEIDRRFREIVKRERPDLGDMPIDGFARLTEARRALRDEAARAQHHAVRSRYAATGPVIGTLVDRRG